MSNINQLVSRNKREGHYAGFAYGKHYRMFTPIRKFQKHRTSEWLHWNARLDQCIKSLVENA